MSLNTNDLNSPIKRHKLTEWIKPKTTTPLPWKKKQTKTRILFWCIQETHLNIKDRHHLSVKHGKRYAKQMNLSCCGPFKIWQNDLTPKLIRRDKGQYVFIKGKIYEEEIAVLNIYALNILRVPKFVKETLSKLKWHIDPHILLWGDFSTNRSSRQKLNREMLELLFQTKWI